MKIEDLDDLEASYRSVQKINENNDKIVDAFENTLSRDGSGPNNMQAPIDMDSNRIVNLGTPIDDNDAARLIDVLTLGGSGGGGSEPIDLSPYAKKDLTNIANPDFYSKGIASGLGGGSGGSVEWDSVLNKPATFPPTVPISQSAVTNLPTDLANKANVTHTHLASQVTDFQEAAEDIIGASLVAGSNVTISYNDATGKTTINAASSPPVSSDLVSLSDYGTIVGDGTTDNKTVFNAAEAATSIRWVYIPEGLYATSNVMADLKKHYWGPGQIKLLGDGAVLANRFSTLRPTTGGGLGITGWFTGDNKGTDPEFYYVPDQPLRKNVNSVYFDGTVTPKNVWMYNYSGHSGSTGHLAATASAGATSATIKTISGGSVASGFAIGDQVGFTLEQATGGDWSTQVFNDVVTITGVTSTTISFTPALANSYPTNSIVAHSHRTMQTHSYRFHRNWGGGDAYVDVARAQLNYSLKDTQLHWVEGATSGLYGGDMVFNAPGNFATGWETSYVDQNNDVSVCAQIDTFIRNNDTGARGATWMGILLKSEGTKPADAAYIVRGPWRIGVDTTGGDFSSNGQAAIQLSTNQRIYFDSGQDPQNGRGTIGGGLYGILWGNVLGNSYITHGTDGQGEYLDLFAGGSYRLKIRGNGNLAFNGAFALPGDINAGQDIICQRDITAVRRLKVGSVDGPVYFYWDGTNLRATKNNMASSVVIV